MEIQQRVLSLLKENNIDDLINRIANENPKSSYHITKFNQIYGLYELRFSYVGDEIKKQIEIFLNNMKLNPSNEILGYILEFEGDYTTIFANGDASIFYGLLFIKKDS
tara:strand:+ start:260 stop:583 length:324 start_codon:yes stop_codon:yes gene_type:complete